MTFFKMKHRIDFAPFFKDRFGGRVHAAGHEMVLVGQGAHVVLMQGAHLVSMLGCIKQMGKMHLAQFSQSEGLGEVG